MSGRAELAAAGVRRWPGMRSEYNWIPPHESATVTKGNQVGISFTDHHGLVLEREGRTQQTDVASGAVFVTADAPITWTRVREPTEALEIYLDRGLLDTLATHAGDGRFDLHPSAGGRDPVVFAAASILKRVHLGEEDLTDVAASTLAHRVAMRLLAGYSSVPSSALRSPPGRLDQPAVSRVAEFVDTNLDAVLSVDRLAAVAGLSPFHFARAFKATTGLAPHQFVTSCRVERAKALLLGSTENVAAIAQKVGFSNLSHFRRVFRRRTGYRPGELRRR